MVGDILGGYASWGPHAALLGDDHRFIAVSPLLVAYAALGQPPPEPWGIGAEGEALAAALDSLGVESAHVGGWSLGGAVALDFAMSHPRRVRALTLVEPQTRWALRAAGRHADPVGDIVRRIAEMPEVDEEALAAFFRHVGAVEPGARPQDSRAWRLAWEHRQTLRYALRVAEHDDDPSRLRAVTAPTLVVRGAATSERDRRITDALADLLPNAELLTLPGGHTSHINAIDEFVRAFRRLAAKADGR